MLNSELRAGQRVTWSDITGRRQGTISRFLERDDPNNPGPADMWVEIIPDKPLPSEMSKGGVCRNIAGMISKQYDLTVIETTDLTKYKLSGYQAIGRTIDDRVIAQHPDRLHEIVVEINLS